MYLLVGGVAGKDRAGGGRAVDEMRRGKRGDGTAEPVVAGQSNFDPLVLCEMDGRECGSSLLIRVPSALDDRPLDRVATRKS